MTNENEPRPVSPLQALYDEYGQEHVGVVRRELTIRTGRHPSYIELLAELALRKGWQPAPPKKGSPR